MHMTKLSIFILMFIKDLSFEFQTHDFSHKKSCSLLLDQNRILWNLKMLKQNISYRKVI